MQDQMKIMYKQRVFGLLTGKTALGDGQTIGGKSTW
jgi:hypothetical protein